MKTIESNNHRMPTNDEVLEILTRNEVHRDGSVTIKAIKKKPKLKLKIIIKI